MLLVVLLLAFALLALLSYNVFARSDFADYQQQLVVSDETVHVEMRAANLTVSCMGRIKNGSSTAWRDFYLETAFLDATGNVIDTLSERAHALYVRPGDETHFRVRGVADKGGDLYKRCRTRIKNASASGFLL